MHRIQIGRYTWLLVCAAVLLTAGIYGTAIDRRPVQAAAAQQQQMHQVPGDKRQPMIMKQEWRKLAAPNVETTSSLTRQPAPNAITKPQTERPAPAEPEGTPSLSDGKEKSTPIEYVTTAYYLNVRNEPTNRSEILRVARKGDLLDVEERLENGWLRLKDAGYVHGNYAEPNAASSRSAPAGPVTITMAPLQPETEEEEVPMKPSSTVLSDSGLTEERIATLLRDTDLADHELEAAILEIEDTYGINAFFTIAVMKLESGNGESWLSKNKNNLFGLNATGGRNKKAFSFKTKADSVRKFGDLISKSYVEKGYTTVEKVAKKYCPANPKWPKLVKSIMSSDFKSI